jgi:integrase/recombinase XerD
VNVADAIDEYLEHCAVERHLSPSTIAAYRNDLGKLRSHLVERCVEWVDDVDRQHLLDFFAGQVAAGDRASSQTRRMAVVSGFFTWLHLQGQIHKLPTRGFARPRKEQRLPELLSRDEIEALIAAPGIDTPLGLRDTAMLEFMYATGARVSEACGLELGALHLDRGLAVLEGKGAKQRLVPIRGAALVALALYLERGRPELVATAKRRADRVFVNRWGLELSRNGWWAKLRALADVAGIERPVHPHLLRHSFATHLLEGGAPLTAIQLLLGHASISSTAIYTRLDLRRIRDEYDRHHPRA